MTRRLPWPTDDGFEFTVTSVAVDGADLTEVIDRETATIRLDGQERWHEIRLAIEVADSGRADSIAVLHNKDAKQRLASTLQPQNGVRVGSLRVVRSAVRGRASLIVFRSAVIDDVGHRIVGESRPWTVDFDEPSSQFKAGPTPIEMMWDSFSEPEKGPPTLRAHQRDRFHVVTTGMEPVVFLNRDLQEFHDLLLYDTATGWKGDLRDAVAADIAGKVLASLAWAATQQTIEDEDGEISPPPGEVLQGVMTALAEHMEGVADLDELNRRVVDVRRDGDAQEMKRLVGDVGAAIERMTHGGDLALRFGKRVLG